MRLLASIRASEGKLDQSVTLLDRIASISAEPQGEMPTTRLAFESAVIRGDLYLEAGKILEAKEAYGSIIDMGTSSSYYELASYKLGWALYKQELYEEALHNYIALLDYRLSLGYDFDEAYQDNEEHRVADTFRVISLSFSNLGVLEGAD